MCAPEEHELGEELKRLEDGDDENEGSNQRMGRGCREPKRPVSSEYQIDQSMSHDDESRSHNMALHPSAALSATRLTFLTY